MLKKTRDSCIGFYLLIKILVTKLDFKETLIIGKDEVL